GIPGAVSNTPPLAPDVNTENPNPGAPDNIRASSSSEVKNYEVSRTVSNTQKPSHRIQKINAAVLVRDQMIADPETGEQTSVPISDETRQKIERLVADTIGIDINRGDSLTVSSSPFMTELEGVSAPWYDAEWVRTAINQLAIILILAIVILGIVRPLLHRILVPAPATSSQLVSGDEEVDLDQIEVGEGESLEDIKAKLKPKKQAISAEMLDTANTYDDKVAVIRMIVADEAGRVSNVFKAMMEKDMAL
ncbi:MAG: flagellar M-ring protein FliF C-terminal domain-containing protein, partial [Candidatus Puniceispirillaceae bacterium]